MQSSTDPHGRAAAPSHPASRAWAASATTAALVAGLGLLAGPLGSLDGADLPTLVLVAAAYVLVQHAGVDVDLHGRGQRVNISELPLIGALFLLPGLGIMLAWLLGGIVHSVLIERQPPYKATWNVVHGLLGAVIAIGIHALLGRPGPTDGLALSVLALLVAAWSVIDLVLTRLMIGWMMRLPPIRHGLIGDPLLDVLPSLTGAGVAVLAVQLVAMTPWLLWVPILMLGLLLLVQRSAQRLAQTNRMQAALLDVTAEVSGDDTVDGTCRHLVDGVRRLLVSVGGDRAAIVAVGLHPPTTTDAGWAGLDGPTCGLADRAVACHAGEGVEHLVVDGRRMVVVPAGDAEGAWLVVVVQRGSRMTGPQQEALAVVANHAGVALGKATHAERVRADAASAAHRAVHDELSGLGNRRAALLAATDAISAGRPTALLHMDVDGFKAVNDALGHEAGDRLLGEVASRLRGIVDEGPTDRQGAVFAAARIAVDEFAVLVLGGRSAAMSAVDRVAQALAAPIAIGAHEIDVTMSIGISLYPDHGVTGQQLLTNADVALHEAKQQRRGTVVFGVEAGERAVRMLTLSSGFRQALAAGQITIAVQPKICLVDDSLAGVEALARWAHPELGQVSPEEFVPIAEQSGLLWEFTSQVIAEALTWHRRWLEAGVEVPVAVNLSPRSLVDPQLPQRITDLLRTHGLGAAALDLELTESSVIADPEHTLPVLHALTAAGFRLSVDDFGTGYSSLSYLSTLPVSEVKIDRSLVAPITQERRAMDLVAGIVELCHRLDLEVVGEGVEDDETRLRLTALGCDRAQGYGLAVPMSPSRLLPWLQDATIHPPRHARLPVA